MRTTAFFTFFFFAEKKSEDVFWSARKLEKKFQMVLTLHHTVMSLHLGANNAARYQHASGSMFQIKLSKSCVGREEEEAMSPHRATSVPTYKGLLLF